MKETKIKALKIKPGMHPCVVELNNDLDSLQKAVSIGAPEQGLIEFVYLGDNVSILCNEEGKLIGLQPNRVLGNDILCGVFYVCGQDRCGNLTSLNEDAVKHYTEVFAECSYISPDDVANTIVAKFLNLEDLL